MKAKEKGKRQKEKVPQKRRKAKVKMDAARAI